MKGGVHQSSDFLDTRYADTEFPVYDLHTLVFPNFCSRPFIVLVKLPFPFFPVFLNRTFLKDYKKQAEINVSPSSFIS